MPEEPPDQDKGVGPWNLQPDIEAARRRGVRRAVRIMMTLFQVGFVFIAVVILWSLWRIGLFRF